MNKYRDYYPWNVSIKKINATDRATHLIRQHGGVIRTGKAIQAGIHPRTLYQMRDNGLLEQLSRGVYRLTGQKAVSAPDLIIVATRIPKAVICLISALSFHEMTTQIPHSISIALAQGSDTPRLGYPPISIHRFSKEALLAGIDVHHIDDVNSGKKAKKNIESFGLSMLSRNPLNKICGIPNFLPGLFSVSSKSHLFSTRHILPCIT